MFASKRFSATLVALGLMASNLAPFVVASPVNGPCYDVHRVEARSTDTFYVTFRGGEDAMVVIQGDHDTDLDLYVYDENGNLIGSDTDNTDQCVVGFHPNWTGTFRIEVRNLGYIYNQYEIGCL